MIEGQEVLGSEENNQRYIFQVEDQKKYSRSRKNVAFARENDESSHPCVLKQKVHKLETNTS